jgi:hydrogenase-4 component E
MIWVIDVVLVLILATNFLALGTTRVRAAVRAAGTQGALLALLPPLLHGHVDVRIMAIAIGAGVLKGIVIPAVLLRFLRSAPLFREIDPYVGYVPSLFLCAGGTGLALLFAGSLPLAPEHAGTLLVPTSLATMFAGFLLMIVASASCMSVICSSRTGSSSGLTIEGMPFLVESARSIRWRRSPWIVLGHIQQHFRSTRNTSRA